MSGPFAKNDIKIAVIGGGTGSFMIISALKSHTKQIAAIVNMVDDGGSTGALRDEFGTLPSGDVRKCLVALSDSPKIRDLFNYRFDSGSFCGHSFGNILLTALEKVTGSFSDAVETASEILRISGVVIPATLDNVRLKMEWPEESLILNGEFVIGSNKFKYDPRKAELSLTPQAKANPLAIEAIEQADMVIISPGDLYISLGPLLIIDGFKDALSKTKATCVYVANLTTKHGQTDGFTVCDHVNEIERFAGVKFIDYVLYNQQLPDKNVAKRYAKEKAYIVKAEKTKLRHEGYKVIGANLLGQMAKSDKADTIPVVRSLIRHDEKAVASALLDIYRRSSLKS